MTAVSDNNRKKLLRAAAELFAEKGYDAVSTRDLCNKAEVNVAAISYYFGGKDGLYLEVFQTYANHISERILHVLAQSSGQIQGREDLEKTLRALIATIVDMRVEEPEVAIVLQKQSIGNIPGVQEAFVAITEPVGDALTKFFQEIQNQQLLRQDLNIRSFLTILIESIWGYFSLQERGMTLLKDAYRLPEERVQFVNFLAELYTRGICS
jgi:AcrR family transcriptional regulator